MAVAPDRLGSQPLFAGLDSEALATIAEWLTERQASEGQRLTPEGAAGYTFFLIEDGAVEVSRDGERIAELGPGDFFGEMAILGEGRRVAEVVSSTPVTLLVLFGTEFRRLEAEFPEVRARIGEAARTRAL